MLALKAAAPPLVEKPDGTIRVAATRVTLDSVVAAFDAGATAEEITYQFPVLTLADVYAVIAWVLQNRGEVDAYLAARETESRAIREEVERQFPTDQLRARLLARRHAK